MPIMDYKGSLKDFSISANLLNFANLSPFKGGLNIKADFGVET